MVDPELADSAHGAAPSERNGTIGAREAALETLAEPTAGAQPSPNGITPHKSRSSRAQRRAKQASENPAATPKARQPRSKRKQTP
jgi:hypothetical protein